MGNSIYENAMDELEICLNHLKGLLSFSELSEIEQNQVEQLKKMSDIFNETYKELEERDFGDEIA